MSSYTDLNLVVESFYETINGESEDIPARIWYNIFMHLDQREYHKDFSDYHEYIVYERPTGGRGLVLHEMKDGQVRIRVAPIPASWVFLHG